MYLLLAILAQSRTAPTTLCTIVRAYGAHRVTLPILLMSLGEALRLVPVDGRFYVIDTDPSLPPTRYIEHALNTAESYFPQHYYQRCHFDGFIANMATYGYDATDRVLSYLMNLIESNRSGDGAAHAVQCDYFLFTNGDNVYSKYFLTTLRKEMESRIDFVAFDMIERTAEWHTEFKFAGIDLGAALVSLNALRQTHVRFLPDGLRTAYLKERDWGFFNTILQHAPQLSRTIVHAVLFAHQ